jgi:hypothetical protein
VPERTATQKEKEEHMDNPETTLVQLQEQQASLVRHLDVVAVTDDREEKDAGDLLIAARGALAQAEETRKGLVRPIDEARDRINALFKPYTEHLRSRIAHLNDALTRYHDAKLKKAEEERLAALAEEAARMAEARETGEVLELRPAPAPEMPTKTARAHLGTVTYREDYDIQVVDPRRVPRDLCEPSMQRIRARVKSGVTEIPGVLVSKRYITVARGGN